MSRFDLGQKGSETFPLIVLFGVILAFLMAFLFITLYSQQLDLRVDEQANALANDLAQTAFAAMSGGQLMFNLPRDAGGSPYKIELQENSIFVVEITGGRRSGKTYSSVVNAVVAVENQDFSPGGLVYFMRSGDTIIMSAEPIVAPIENIAPIPTGEPPEFYYFAKEKAKVATAVIAAYFFTLENYHMIDVTKYSDQGDTVLVQISSQGEELFGVRVSYENGENSDNVGMVGSALIVTNLSIIENLDVGDSLSENVENAWKSGWLYSPSQALEHLRGRTWRRENDNTVVAVPSDATIRAAAATTNISTYPTWRVEWQSDNYYVIHFQAMPWWEQEDTAGFVFQSDPELEPVV